ncbi:MAG: PQQ-binding-like beta-propeller repeat protein [Thermoanaerobaculia bacterium]
MTGQARNEHDISPASASLLTLAWTDQMPGPIASSPTVVGGRLYIGDWAGNEWEVDAATGGVIESVNLGTTSAAQCSPPSLGITSAAAVDSGRLFVAGGDDSFYALDALTLETLWKTRLGDNSPAGGYYGWSSPSPWRGTVFQGISSNCDNPFIEGQVVALDAASGSIVSSANLSETQDPTQFGAGVWSSPAIDVDSGSIFVTTASAYSYSDGLAYSIVRLSQDGLTVEDSWKISLAEYQATADADWGSSPTLFDNSHGRPLVGANQKNGNYYCFDRRHLASGYVWKTEIAIDGPCPQCGQGGISTAAFDGTRLYVGGGTPPPETNPPAGIRGAVTALDPSTGEVLWRFAGFGGPVLSPVSTANGVVFAAAGRFCVALDAATGDLLWKSGVAASDIYGGVPISDGRIFFGDTLGNLYCYEIPRGSSEAGSDSAARGKERLAGQVGGPFP